MIEVLERFVAKTNEDGSGSVDVSIELLLDDEYANEALSHIPTLQGQIAVAGAVAPPLRDIPIIPKK
jgi:hypothetical protein